MKEFEVSIYKQAVQEIIEIYAGMEGIDPKTTQEVYQKRIIGQMVAVATDALTNQE